MSDKSRTEAQRGADIEDSLFFLMTRFGVCPCDWLAEAIKHQLEMLLRQPGDAHAAKARLYCQLLPAWRHLAAETAHIPEDMAVTSAAISLRSAISPAPPWRFGVRVKTSEIFNYPHNRPSNKSTA